MAVLELTDLRRAAVRLEMADGRVQSLAHGTTADHANAIEQARFDRESERNAFRLALTEATGLSPDDIARLLAL
jgi:hypothetical protein